MVVDVCDYFDTDLLVVPLAHFGLCEQAVLQVSNAAHLWE